MVDGINEYLAKATPRVARERARYWNRDFSSPDAHERSIEPNRAKLRRIIGAVDARAKVSALRFEASTASSSLVGQAKGYKIHAVRWPVFAGVEAEGLLLEPDRPPVARVVAIPDAGVQPEALTGLAPGVDPQAQFARRLAESGCLVLIPVLIDRADTWSEIPGVRATNLPHREWIYRMAFEAGRHIIGYEVQKVLAAVDWFESDRSRGAAPAAVAGYGEGGLIAFYSAALDPRIQGALVSGYFQPREALWSEPIYRDVWGLLTEFGDAEIAGMIAPRALVVEASRFPAVQPPPAANQKNQAAPNGRLTTPPVETVKAEAERAREFFRRLNAAGKLHVVASGDGTGLPGTDTALSALLASAGVKAKLAAPGNPPAQRSRGGESPPAARARRPAPAGQSPLESRGPGFDPAGRLKRQFDQLVDYTQRLIRESPSRREQFWSKADASSPERWRETTGFYRAYIWDEVIGRMPPPGEPANVRTRLIYDQPKHRGYEVVMDVWPGVFAYGILLVPKDLKPGERRPVVVCQHGLEGRPGDLADANVDHPAYHRYAARLADEGFITYAPQNPYIGQDRFRMIQRRGHPLKLALFSFILGQHQRHLEWLSGLPFVDPQRIGFYGLSYGGKTAVRVPPLLDQYALSICSADFNEWVWKTTSVDSRFSYMVTQEYDMLEFDFANVVNYAELGMLMAPRPFMVERGHADGVAPDEWVAYEFARVRRFYETKMKLPGRAEIEFFDGPHTIHGAGTFEFLRRHLKWPR
jgi:dienelactone hydrolase